MWSIADPATEVSDKFRKYAIENYVVFILQLGWAPSEIYYGHVDTIKGLEAWRDIFLKELNHSFAGFADQQWVLRDTVRSLDRGKRYVTDGYDWLCTELFNAPNP